MARFRKSGTNWEGRAWKLPPSVLTLAEQVETTYPLGHPADGTVASKLHDAANPSSDHRPKPYTGAGIVRGLDAGGEFAAEIAEALRLSKDPRLKYVIHDGRLFSSYPKPDRAPFEWGAYSGAPHTTHVHISVLESADANGSLWRVTLEEEDDMPTVEEIWGAQMGGKPGSPSRKSAAEFQVGAYNYARTAAANAGAALEIARQLAAGVTLTPADIEAIAEAVEAELEGEES